MIRAKIFLDRDFIKASIDNRLFGSFIEHLGRAVYGQPITRQAIYGWVAGRSTPRPALALRIVGLAHGRLTLADLYRQRFGAAEAQAQGCPHAGSVAPAGVQAPAPDR